MPKVSVILAAYNAEATIKATLASLARSRMRDFEAIVVEDASTDSTLAVLAEVAAADRRVRVLENAKNRGLGHSLNRAIAQADGEYLARLDADDLILPHRLTSQVSLLDHNSGISIVGMGCYSISAGGEVGKYKPPNCPSVCIPWTVTWGVPFAHPTVMMRRRDLETDNLRYDHSLPLAQDYDLWSRLLRKRRGANMMRPGILYRVHAGQATGSRRNLRLDIHGRVSAANVASIMSSSVDPRMIEMQRALFLGEAARCPGGPTLREAVEFRQDVCARMVAGGEHGVACRLGFGLDLLRLVALGRARGAEGWLARNRFRATAMTLAAPLLAREIIARRWYQRQAGRCDATGDETVTA